MYVDIWSGVYQCTSNKYILHFYVCGNNLVHRSNSRVDVLEQYGGNAKWI